MLRDKKRIHGFCPLEPEEMKFIRDNHKPLTVKEMIARLHRGAKIIYEFMESENLSRYRGNKNTSNHPWRKANHQLENYVMDRQRKPINN